MKDDIQVDNATFLIQNSKDDEALHSRYTELVNMVIFVSMRLEYIYIPI